MIERDTQTSSEAMVSGKGEHDPFSDDESHELPTLSIESIESFWICVAGLGVLAQTAIFTGKWYSYEYRDWLFQRFFSCHLAPCLVLVSVIPLLFWRGSTTQRHIVAFALIATGLNRSAVGSDSHLAVPSDFQSYLALATCWVMLPVLLLYTPVRTEKLRLIIGSCMLVIVVCVSVITAEGVRGNEDLLHWLLLFGAAIAFALIFRNWVRVALLEAGTTELQIENTSIRSLMEIMALCGLACASWLYLAQSIYPFEFLCTVLLAVGITSISMAIISRPLRSKQARTLVLIVCWVVLTVLIQADHSSDYFFHTLRLNRLKLFAFHGIECVPLLAYCFCIGFWVRWCGWRRAGAAKLRG